MHEVDNLAKVLIKFNGRPESVANLYTNGIYNLTITTVHTINGDMIKLKLDEMVYEPKYKFAVAGVYYARLAFGEILACSCTKRKSSTATLSTKCGEMQGEVSIKGNYEFINLLGDKLADGIEVPIILRAFFTVSEQVDL